MAFRVELDQVALERFATKGDGAPELEVALMAVARKIMAAAKADQLPKWRHNYRRKFGTDAGENEGQICAVVYNTDFTAWWVEWGAHASGKTPVLGYHVMMRALEAVASSG